jgi:hypothetical protein
LAGYRRHESYATRLEKTPELAPEGGESTRLDLDEQVPTNHIDDIAIDRLLEEIAIDGIPFFELGVERPLVECSDHEPMVPAPPPMEGDFHGDVSKSPEPCAGILFNGDVTGNPVT